MDGERTRFTLKKKEKLCSKRSFDLLFKSKKSCYSGGIQFIFSFELPSDTATAEFMVAFSVPKRNFKRAVDRNLLKRRMREAYRMHKHALTEALHSYGKFGACVIKYNAREIRSFIAIEQDMVRGIEKMMRQL